MTVIFEPTLVATGSISPRAADRDQPAGFAALASRDAAFRARFGTPVPLAEGGLGEVYLALDRTLPGWTVVKTPRPGADSMATRLLFEAEIAFSSRLSAHPHFAQVLSSGWLAGRRYLQLRHYGGGTLSALLEGGCDVLHLLGLVVQVLRALEFAHRVGILHGDVSESQVLLDEDRTTAVLADLGAARVLPGHPSVTAMPPPIAGGEVTLYIDHATVDMLDRIERAVHGRLTVGKLSYMAPERLARGARPDPIWDVHAIAVILYRALAGYRPHEVAGVADHDLRGMAAAALPTVEAGLRWAGRLGRPRWPAVEQVVDAVMRRDLVSARQLRQALSWALEEERWRRRDRTRASTHRAALADELQRCPRWRWWRRRRLYAELRRLR